MKTRQLAMVAPVVLLASAWLYAGPLNPPVGPITSTGKTTQEIFDKAAAAEARIAINLANTPGDADSLFKITQPGSYYLTGNVTGVVGKHGIEIVTSGVTIDLNGFDLVGVPGMGAFDGVTATVANLTDIEVRNGSVRDWGDEGVDLGTFNASSSVVTSVRASGNAGDGIQAGLGCIISGCTAYSNTGVGISASTGANVSGCTASSNGLTGIQASSSSTISGCTAYSNTGDGISGSGGSTISGCTASSNTGNGISASGDCHIIGNICDGNGSGVGNGAGILVTSSDNRIEGNSCTNNDRGIDVNFAGNIIIRNTCSGNTTNWDIVANNVCGPILDRTAPASAAILGNSAPDSTGSTHPNANFTF